MQRSGVDSVALCVQQGLGRLPTTISCLVGQMSSSWPPLVWPLADLRPLTQLRFALRKSCQ